MVKDILRKQIVTINSTLTFVSEIILAFLKLISTYPLVKQRLHIIFSQEIQRWLKLAPSPTPFFTLQKGFHKRHVYLGLGKVPLTEWRF